MASVLIIDDDELMRTYLVESFEAAGYEVRFARDGKEGVAAYADRPADLVITDLFMPEQDGVEVVQALVGQDPDVKIIAVSGGDKLAGRKDVLEVMEDLGARRTFAKPFEIEEVLKAAEEILDSED